VLEMTPPLDASPWPTLGPQLRQFIETYLVHGPGDLLGEPYRLDDEKYALLCRLYEVYPQGHPQAGRRRFRHGVLMLQKGSAKTEFAAILAACEAHPDAPIRCDGFDGNGQPVGHGLGHVYIPLVAYTQEQSDDLCYSVLKVILEKSVIGNDFDIGTERILRKDGSGSKIVALATAPDARDGALTTFDVRDETHRWTLPRLKAAHRTLDGNLAKRRAAEPWSLSVTTAYTPGEGSVAEDQHTYARSIIEGKRQDARLFAYYRYASDVHDLETPEGRMAAVKEAAGPTAAWKDLDAIVEQWDDPTADRAYLERVWLNRPVQAAAQAFSAERWKELAQPAYRIPHGAGVTLGFDGAIRHDSTAIVMTEIETGHQQLMGIWERPSGAGEWETPADEVDATIAQLFADYSVWRLYADPYWWETWVARWQGRHGDKEVIEWRTNRLRQMAFALQAYRNAIEEGSIHHDGNEVLARHIGNAVKSELNLTDDRGLRLWVIKKDRPDSPFKIDAAMASILSWEARTDAIAAGVTTKQYAGVHFIRRRMWDE
jgi:phage terminase large subunit-like protein